MALTRPEGFGLVWGLGCDGITLRRAPAAEGPRRARSPRPGSRAFALVLSLLVLAPAARADDGDSSSERTIGLPGTLGLTGFGDMVDARIPKLLSIRAGARYQTLVQDRDFKAAFNATRRDERHDLVFYGGVSALSLVDVAARLPFTYIRGDTDIHGFRETIRARHDSGWADLDVAGKVALDLGPVSLAPYLFGRVPSGEAQVRDLARFEYGAAATFSLFEERIGLHANLVGVSVEEGLQALRYRAGVSVVPWSDDAFSVRFYAYGDGIEYEGHADSDFDLEFGVQAIIGTFITVELGITSRIKDADFIDDDLKDDLRREGIFERHIDDDGTWGVVVGAGVLF